MLFPRKVIGTVAVTLLVLTLFGLGLVWSIHQTFGTARSVEQALAKSGIYQSIVADVLHSKQGSSSSSTPIPIDQPQVRQVIESAFPPRFLQSQTEQVINAVYAWLNGKSPSLQFTVDLSAAKLNLADGIEQYTIARLTTLPICPANEIPSGDINPFSITCVAGGINIHAVAVKEREAILNGDFLKNSTISANTIRNNDGKPLSQELQAAPTAYRRAKLGLYANALLALALAILVVFMSTTWRPGLHKVSTILIIIGTVSASLGWISSFAIHHALLKIASIQATDKAIQQQVFNIAQSLVDSLRVWWITYGVTLLVLGIATLVALHLTATKQAKKVPDKLEATSDELASSKTDPSRKT